jgi:hypothetical protein
MRALWSGRDERGQILPLFALFLVALFALAALLFDASHAVTLRRQYQDAGDAAALAAANVIQSGNPRGCSAAPGPPPGSPRTAVSDAAELFIWANLPSYPSGNVIVTCPDGWSNQAVRVQLSGTAPSFFRSVIGGGPLTVNTTSTAVNGLGAGNGYSVMTLNPYNATWPVARRGCPGMLFAGSPNVEFHGSVQINSACPASGGGALTQSGSASTVTMDSGSYMDVTGQSVLNGLTVLPNIREFMPARPDPLINLPAPNIAALPVRSASQLQIGPNQRLVLDPGVYVGGINVRNNSTAYLRPGIYVMNGGGLTTNATAKIYTISSTFNPPASYNDTNWATSDCPQSTCGVLIYNTGGALMGQWNVIAGTVFKVRAYNFQSDPGPARKLEYTNLLLWQDRLPLPSSSYSQPTVNLNGGAGVLLSGTVYAPSAPVRLGGTSGGGSGWAIDYTLQFIVWELTFSGSSNWRFAYADNTFALPPDYGLVE